MSTYVYKLPERLKALRAEKGWTLQRMANELETTRVTCGYYESGTRHPNAEMIGIMCRVFDVSADYLLGLASTKKPRYANIADVTGLTEEAILSLDNPGFQTQHILNRLICEEPALAPWEISSFEPDPEYLAYLNRPDVIEKEYKEHLEFLAREREQASRPILDHLQEDWTFGGPLSDEEIAYYNSPEYIAEMEQKAIQNQQEMAKRYDNLTADDLVGSDCTYEEHMEHERCFYEALEKHKKAEAAKSNLLSAIAAFVAYESGCVLETRHRSEKLTEVHKIQIGTGHGAKITFPSKEGDDLLEFAMLQRVIDALRIFKKNYYSAD